MKKQSYNSISLVILLFFIGMTSAKAQEQTISTDSLGTRYTIAINNLSLTVPGSDFAISVCSGSKRAATLHITQDSIWNDNGDTTVVAEGLELGSAPHSYRIVRIGTSNVQLYKDSALLCTFVDVRMNEKEFGVTVTPRQVADGYTVTILSATTAIKPDEAGGEANIGNMLSGLTNLCEDAYCNRGFSRKGENSDERSFYSNAALFTGWGNNALIETVNGFSGNSIKIWGQASYPNEGASLDQAITFKASTPYLVRLMAKSEGYTGRVAIGDEKSYLTITDTGSEWMQLEGVLTPSAARNLLYLNNSDYTNSGTLYVDNFEVYEGYTSTASVPSKGGNVAAVQLKATEKWSPANKVFAYSIGFTESGTSHSQIDTAKVKVMGCTSLTKKVAGSQLYALYFPGDLNGMSVSGKFDGKTVQGEPIIEGLDYILQYYDYPRFEFKQPGDPTTSGCYIVQFVDNIDAQTVTLNFSGRKSGKAQTGSYRFTGNQAFADQVPNGKYLKFNAATQRFELTEDESIIPFEAYIESDELNPVNYIYTGYNTKLQRITADDGNAISVCGVKGGINIYSTASTAIDIHSVTGQKVQTVQLGEGNNFIAMPKGLYLTCGKKVAILH